MKLLSKLFPLLFSTLSLFIWSSCQSQKQKTTVPVSIQHTDSIARPEPAVKPTEPLKMDTATVHKIYQDLTIKDYDILNPCTHIELNMSFPKNNKAIKDSIFSCQKAFLNDTFRDMGRRRKLTLKQYQHWAKDKDIMPMSELEFSDTLIFDGTEAATIQYTYYHYPCGAAHGGSILKADTYFKRTGQRVEEYDIICTDSIDTFKRIYNQCFAQLEKQYDANVTYKIDQPFETRPQMFLTSKGIAYQYQEYQFTCYAAGRPRLVIPYTLLKDILQTDAPIATYKTNKR